MCILVNYISETALFTKCSQRTAAYKVFFTLIFCQSGKGCFDTHSLLVTKNLQKNRPKICNRYFISGSLLPLIRQPDKYNLHLTQIVFSEIVRFPDQIALCFDTYAPSLIFSDLCFFHVQFVILLPVVGLYSVALTSPKLYYLCAILCFSLTNQNF